MRKKPTNKGKSARPGLSWKRDLLFASGIFVAVVLLLMLRDQEGRSFIYAVF
jgi:hypothetical protein